MIKSLRRKFIAVAMCAIVIVLTLIIGCINAFSFADVINKSDERISLIAANNGTLSKEPEPSKSNNDSDKEKKTLPEISPETPFETRYFTVMINDSGSVSTVDTGKIAAISTSEASDYALELYEKDSRSGFYGNYRYGVVAKSSGTQYIFLDCSRELSSFYSFLLISVLISVSGIAVVFVLVLIFSKIAVRPFAQSYEKQKRFITDASHEIKTPLTIIEANTEIIEMTDGENEWTHSTRNQIKRLSSLTEKLVFLARTDENAGKLDMCDFSLSDAVAETTDGFAAVIKNCGKTLETHIEEGISLKGNEASIRELVSVLLDNAVKYSDENGTITVALSQDSGKSRLVVGNTVQSIEKGWHDILFERFYRADASRSSETGGSGIGLSIAKAVVMAHKGKIHAKSTDERSFEVTVTF